jgi:hypothetical protein
MAGPAYTSPNFAFLAKHDDVLVHHAALDDPNSALIKLRQFGELLAQHAAASEAYMTYRISFLLVLVFLGWPTSLLSSEPIPEQTLHCVGYLTTPNPRSTKDNPLPNALAGTAFVVGYEYKEKPSTAYLFLVTARHVLFDAKGQRLSKLYLRMNHKETGKALDFGPLRDNRWVLASDPAIDLAIYLGLPKQASYLRVPNSLFVSDQDVTENSIGIGDEVFFVGLLPYHAGQEKITPIVRFGRLALLTEEKTTNGQYYHFIDADNLPGHSGAPLFLWATPTRTSGHFVIASRIMKLWGVVSGVIEYPKPLKALNVRPTARISIDYRSGGVTAVVPIKHLEKILQSDQVRKAVSIHQAEESVNGTTKSDG